MIVTCLKTFLLCMFFSKLPEVRDFSADQCANKGSSSETEPKTTAITGFCVENSTNKGSSSETQPKTTAITGFCVENSTKKRKDKPHWCLFCDKSTTKLRRHFLSFHKGERDLSPYLNATKSKRNVELSKLRNLGDHMHNRSVWEKGTGEIVVKRKGRAERGAKCVEEFVPCPDCLGYYHKKDLWRHHCVARGKEVHTSRSKVIAGKLLLPPIPGSKRVQGPDEELAREILEHLKGDPVGIVVKTDPLIFQLALRETRKNGFDRDRHPYIRNKLREIGRLVLALRQTCGMENGRLSDFLKPELFTSVVEATREVAEYASASSDYNKPSLAKKLGHTLRRCVLLLQATAIEHQDTQLRQQCKLFLELFDARWNEWVSSQAARTLYRRQQNCVKRLPLSEDIQKLSAYLAQTAKDAKVHLAGSSSSLEKKRARQNLCKALLSQVILFNRRRSGEVSKMKVADYRNRQVSTVDDITQSLSSFEQSLCKSLVRVEIIGKTGRLVPVLLTAEMVDSFDTLLQSRNEAGIPDSNIFVFTQSSNSHCDSKGHIRGSDTLKVHCQEASLKLPELVTSTSLRKHVATMSQLYNLKDNELDLVAQYLGHDIRTHRQYYRLPSATLQMAKVAKVLLQMESGDISRNKSLDDIDISDDIVPDEEDPDHEEEAEEDDGIQQQAAEKADEDDNQIQHQERGM